MNPPRALVAARCLTRMRELSTYGGHPTLEGEPEPPMQARILLGGKPSGYSSFMPGLFEEFLISRTPPNNRLSIPVFVIGAFGGAAGQLAAALLDNTRRTLTLVFQLKQAATEDMRTSKDSSNSSTTMPPTPTLSSKTVTKPCVMPSGHCAPPSPAAMPGHRATA